MFTNIEITTVKTINLVNARSTYQFGNIIVLLQILLVSLMNHPTANTTFKLL